MKKSYEIVLRSKKLDVSLPDIPRDFGGVTPGGATYSKDIIEKQFSSDATAERFAREEAKRRDMVLLRVTKTLYNNPSGWRAG